MSKTEQKQAACSEGAKNLTRDQIRYRQKVIVDRLGSALRQVSFLGETVVAKPSTPPGLGDLSEGVSWHLLENKQMLERLWGLGDKGARNRSRRVNP